MLPMNEITCLVNVTMIQIFESCYIHVGHTRSNSRNSLKYMSYHDCPLNKEHNRTLNDNEDIYSGIVRIDTVRIVFLSRELYGLSCCACDIGNAFLYGKINVKVYITAGPEFEASLHGISLIIDKSLHGLNTSATRLHEHLYESLLRLGFKKTKHNPYLWMLDKSSHYEYLARRTNHHIMNI
jgi:hypothetical protein